MTLGLVDPPGRIARIPWLQRSELSVFQIGNNLVRHLDIEIGELSTAPG